MEACHQPLGGDCVSESYITHECEQRSSWKYSKVMKMATRRVKLLHSNGNEVNVGRCATLFPFATEMWPVASQNLW